MWVAMCSLAIEQSSVWYSRQWNFTGIRFEGASKPCSCYQALVSKHMLCRFLKHEDSCRATIAQVRQHRWVAQDYKPCRLLQSVASTELSEYIFEETVQPQDISQV